MKHNQFRFDSGYSAKSRFTLNIFNVCTAGIVLLLSLPLFLILPLIIKLQDGGPVFYKGKRLGKNKQKFTMYKFRTLVVDAEQAVGAQLVSTSPLKLVTPVGHFLRETRLDELPQLLNVLRGDMDIIGPRPEREIVYEENCKHIPWYDKRFSVKPGLIGYSQLFTPHSASRRTRALIDNYYLNRRHQVTLDITLLFYAFSVLLVRLVSNFFAAAPRLFRKMLFISSPEDKRGYRRIRRDETELKIRFQTGEADSNTLNLHYDLTAQVVNMNDKYVLIFSESAIEGEIERVELTTAYRPALKYNSRYKSVHCSGTLVSSRATDNGYYHVLELRNLTELNSLKLHKYFLNKSIS